MNAISVQGLGKRFGNRAAVEGLTFEVPEGEVFGLLGPNGAGKTTSVRMLTGMIRPSEGSARVCGHDVERDGERLRAEVGLLTEQPGLYDRLTARENLTFFIKLHELDAPAAWALAERYLKRFGLDGREDELCGSFSKGMRQKLAIVRTLLHRPKVIFLDEPTSGLDPESARTVRDAVAELAAEGRTIVLCSHNLPEVERLCTQVAVVKGKLLALAKVSELRREGLVLDVKVKGDADRFLPALARLPFAPSAFGEGPLLRVPLAQEDEAPAVIRALVEAGAEIYSASRAARPLEEVYLELIRGEQR